MSGKSQGASIRRGSLAFKQRRPEFGLQPASSAGTTLKSNLKVELRRRRPESGLQPASSAGTTLKSNLKVELRRRCMESGLQPASSAGRASASSSQRISPSSPLARPLRNAGRFPVSAVKTRPSLLLAGLCAVGLPLGFAARKITAASPGTTPAISAQSAGAREDGRAVGALDVEIPHRKSADTAASLLALEPGELCPRLAAWLGDAAEPEIAAFWKDFARRTPVDEDAYRLIFLAWALLDPRGARAPPPGGGAPGWGGGGAGTAGARSPAAPARAASVWAPPPPPPGAPPRGGAGWGARGSSSAQARKIRR